LKKELNIPMGVPVIGFIGTFAGYEGLDDLILSCAELKRHTREFHVLLVGDGAASNLVNRMITELNLGAHFTTPGRVPHSEIQRYYSLADLMVYPRKPLPVCEMVSPLKPFEA